MEKFWHVKNLSIFGWIEFWGDQLEMMLVTVVVVVVRAKNKKEIETTLVTHPLQVTTIWSWQALLFVCWEGFFTYDVTASSWSRDAQIYDLWDAEFWSTCVGEWMNAVGSRKEGDITPERGESELPGHVEPAFFRVPQNGECHPTPQRVHEPIRRDASCTPGTMIHDSSIIRWSLPHECGQLENMLVLFWCFLLVFGRRPRWPF